MTTTTIPRIISVDDHLVEPKTLWTDRLPKRYHGTAPHVVREKVGYLERPSVAYETEVREEDGQWADVWHYEDTRRPLLLIAASVGHSHDEMDYRTITYDQMRPGCYDPSARLADMDIAGVEASMCFPNLEPVRFCGQGFLEAKDKDLAHLCVKAYNDFMVDEWCAGSNGRLIPLGIIPLWSPELAADEVRRTAAMGMRAICFSEAPARLGLPSIHTEHWDPVFRACDEAQVVVMIHVGSSSHIQMPSDDAPGIMATPLITNNATTALVDWMFSGVFLRFPNLKVCFAECQIGWIPYYLQICDDMWANHRGLARDLKAPDVRPSDFYRSNMYVTFFNDPVGLQQLDIVGVDQVMCETDYPHSQTTWPNSQGEMRQQIESAGLDDMTTEKILRGNARRLFRLD